MTKFTKASIGLAMAAMIAAPVAASATPTFDGAQAISTTAGESELEGNSSWIIGLLGFLGGVVATALVIHNDKDSPVSP